MNLHDPDHGMATPPQMGSPASYPSSTTDGDSTSPQASLRTMSNTLATGEQSDRFKDLFGIDIDTRSPIDGLEKVCTRFAPPLATTLHASWNHRLT